jgi:uncharacterized protein YndB with AHSA1/START domain
MPYSYTLSTVIPASPAEIYRAWLDSILHAEMTGGEANMSEEVGAEVSAWDGYITGRNLELIADERIVQSWRTTEFDDAFEDSIVTILLQETEDGTLLTLEHCNVPDAQRSYEEGGWQSNYFEPMIAYFASLRGEALVEPDAESAPPPEGAMNAPAPAPKSARSAGRRRKASAGPQRRVATSVRKAKPVAAKKKKATERSAKAGKKASSAPAKRAAKKSSAKAAAKTSAKTSPKSTAKRGGAKKAARASGSRRKSARGRRR